MRISIDGETRIYGLLGSNIAYTRSPAMHNHATQVLGINATYLPLCLDAATFPVFLNAAYSMNFDGFNVTQPHKEIAAGIFPESGLSSINTIYRTPQGWRATSTDGEGFANSLRRIKREISSYENMVFIGAGGAVSAVLEYLNMHQKHQPSVTILRRSGAKDDALKLTYKGNITFTNLTVADLAESLKGAKSETLLIQASSAPLKGDDLEYLVPALSGFSGSFVDMVYNNPSKLYFAALSADLNAIDGEPMLIEQARAAQKIWWGKSASYEDMLLALRGKISQP